MKHVNLQLRVDDLNMIKTKISAGFEAKLLLYKMKIGKHEFENFLNLSVVSFNNDDWLNYSEHIRDEFKKRFQNILNRDIPNFQMLMQHNHPS